MFGFNQKLSTEKLILCQTTRITCHNKKRKFHRDLIFEPAVSSLTQLVFLRISCRAVKFSSGHIVE